MITTAMREYEYFTYGVDDGYGQPILSATPTGTIRLAINITTQSIQDNINYSDAEYIGLTLDGNVSDKYVISYGGDKLKVLYVNPMGKYIQVFLKRM